MRRKTRSFHSLKVLSLVFHSFIHLLLIFLFISICFESLLDVGKHAEVYAKAYIEAYARAYVKASGSQEVLAMGRQDGARLACKGGIPLLLYELLYCRNVGVLGLGTLGSTGTRRSQHGMFAYAAVLLVCI